MGTIHDIYWLTAPLVVYTRTGLHLLPRPVATFSEKLAHMSRMEHWAIQVEDVCYEVTAVDKVPGTAELAASGKGVRTYVLMISPAEEWWHKYEKIGAVVRKEKVGQTRLGTKERRVKADLIWEHYHHSSYNVADRNCQNFATLFERLISVAKNDPSVSFSEMETWKKMSVPFNHLLAGSAKAGIGIGGMAKASGLLFCAHPVLGIVALGAAAAVARRKDKHWIKDEFSKLEGLKTPDLETLDLETLDLEMPELTPGWSPESTPQEWLPVLTPEWSPMLMPEHSPESTDEWTSKLMRKDSTDSQPQQMPEPPPEWTPALPPRPTLARA